MHITKLALNLAVSALLVTVAGKQAYAERTQSINTSPNDHREYRAVTLDNDLDVLLVSDSKAQKSAASLDINIGSGSDPKDRSGLAHFLEHMLFLGTEKYPEAGEYKKFINTHGGSNNAYTSYDHTNYFFDISSSHFEPALDRFGQFFTAPLFNTEYVKRERNAVNSEYLGNLKSDGRRIFAVNKLLYNPQHPASRFSTGSLQTLADRPESNLRNEVVALYNKHYSSNIMRLVLVGPHNLDDLHQWASKYFSAIPNRKVQPQSFSMPLYRDNLLPALVTIKPEKEYRTLTLRFPMPHSNEHYKSKPLYLISHLIGHEGENSLLSQLKGQGLVNALSASSGMTTDQTGSFDVRIALTEAGLAHYEQVVDRVFETLELVRRSGIEKWRFTEQQRSLDIAYQFQESTEPSAYARGLADAMHRYPLQEVISAGYEMSHFDAELIAQQLTYMTPDNLLLTLTAPQVSTDQLEATYQVPYSIQPIGTELLDRWRTPELSGDIRLPPPNVFLPQDLSLLPADAQTDKPVFSQHDKIRLWHQVDLEFGAPRANLYVSIRTPMANGNPEKAVIARLYTSLIEEQLNEYSYPASLAGLGYSIYAHRRGISLRINGYNDKQGELLDTILATIGKPDFNQETFDRVKTSYIRSLDNRQKNSPDQRTIGELHHLLNLASWPPTLLAEAARGVTLDQLREFAASWHKQNEVVALVHGNVGAEVATRYAQQLDKLLEGTTQVTVPSADIVHLRGNQRLQREIDTSHQDSAVAYYVQTGSRDPQRLAQTYLLAQLLEAPFYNEIRTRKQLGYSVHSFAMPVDKVPAIVMAIQSPVAAPAQLVGHIESFLLDFKTTAQTLPQAEFEAVKSGLLNQLLTKDKKLSDRSGRYWREIDNEEFNFDSLQQLANQIEAVTIDEVVALAQAIADPAKAGRIISWSAGTEVIEGEQTTAVAGVAIADSVDFRTSHGQYQ